MTRKIKTGIEGLDEILDGGLLPNKSYLIQGGPGSGKSTLGYHFLEEGNKNNENTLLISLSEQKESIIENSLRQNIDLSATQILDLSPESSLYEDGETYGIFSPSDVEQKPLMQKIKNVFDQHKPSRVVLDSVTMFNMLSDSPYHARTLILSFIRYLSDNDATLLMLSEQGTEIEEASFWVSGVINLSYDSNWRNIKVTKLRGSDFQSGQHAFKITDTGLEIFPQLKPNKYERKFDTKQLQSGIEGVDEMLKGGIERGSTTLLTGPSGIGKTNLGVHFISQAASLGERSTIYSFEESREVILTRSKGINIPIDEIIEQHNLKIESIEPLSYSPDEFTKMVRKDVEENDTRIVMIDSIGGYKLAVGEENALARLHSLCVYLQNMGVTTILINENPNIFGDLRSTQINASYLADNIIFFRYLEHKGALLKSLGILKKRLSDFENQLRRFQITNNGIIMGKTLENMRGILTGQPEMLTNDIDHD